MVHKIFISYTSQDNKLAEEIKRILNNSFMGDIEFFLAHHDIQSGDSWKEEIKSNLETSNAIISIITKNSFNKPWIFIEWSAFWLAGKKFYVLATDEIKASDLINPMQDLQLTFITNVDSVKGLFNRLARDAEYKKGVPYNMVDDFVISVKSAIIEQEKEFSEKTYARYKDNLDLLPANDREKEEIAMYFLQFGDFEAVVKISKRIKNMHTKANIAGAVLSEGQPDVCHEICKDIWSAGILAQITIQYIENGFEDAKYVRSLIEEIVNKDQGQLRYLATYLAEQGKEDTELFGHIIDEFTNMAELRKVASFLVENDRHETELFYDILDRFSDRNRAELRKVGSSFVLDEKYNSPSFEALMKILIQNNQREAAKLIKELKDVDENLFNKYKQQITNTGARESLE